MGKGERGTRPKALLAEPAMVCPSDDLPHSSGQAFQRRDEVPDDAGRKPAVVGIGPELAQAGASAMVPIPPSAFRRVGTIRGHGRSVARWSRTFPHVSGAGTGNREVWNGSRSVRPPSPAKLRSKRHWGRSLVERRAGCRRSSAVAATKRSNQAVSFGKLSAHSTLPRPFSAMSVLYP